MTLPEFCSPSNNAEDLLAGAQDRFGFIPNAHRVFSVSRRFYESYLTLFGLFSEADSLSEEERHIVFLTVSNFHDCGYCVAAHSMMAVGSALSNEQVEAIKNRQPLDNMVLSHPVMSESRMVE